MNTGKGTHLGEVRDKAVVEVLATEMGVSVGGLNLEDTLVNAEEGHIKGTTTEIEDQDVAFTTSLLVKTVSNSSCGRLIDDAQNLQSRNRACVLGGLTLAVIEVRGHGDDGLLHSAVQVRLCDVLHLRKDHGGDFLRSESLGLALVLHLQDGLVSGALDDRKRPMLHIILDSLVRKFAADEALRVEDPARLARC
jgi:hypothetical protein